MSAMTASVRVRGRPRPGCGTWTAAGSGPNTQGTTVTRFDEDGRRSAEAVEVTRPGLLPCPVRRGGHGDGPVTAW